MGVSQYKFVSPGVQVSEIDNSQLPALPVDYGPVIIGRAVRGPARPVVVNSFSDFVEIFGNPVPGGAGGDVWREGNYTAPTYGAYAAQAWLKNNSPVTYVRLLGEEHPDATLAGAAGWEASEAYGLFIGNSGSVDDWGTAVLAAVFYLNESSSISLIGTNFSDEAVDGTNAVVQSNAGSYGFRIGISGPSGFSYTSSFDFDKTSERFIRKVFNTNPTLSNAEITQTSAVKPYWLGESFEKALYSTLDSEGAAGEQFAVLMKLASTTMEWDGANYRLPSNPSRTGWIFSQDMSTETGSYTPDDMTKLFRFVSLETGEWDQKNLKISIADVKAPVSDYNTYGSFAVEIRKANDTDSRPQVVERFTNCNLNPASENYIARKIGDMYQEWDYVESRYRWYGNYVNNSKFIRVEMNPDVDAGVIDAQLLPFGFYGPPVQAAVSYDSGSATISDDSFIGTVDSIDGCPEGMICSFAYPALDVRESSSLGELSVPKRAYWGITTGRSNTSTRFDESYMDMVRINTFDFDDESASASLSFTLDDVCWASGSQTDAVYTYGARAAGTSITAGTSYDVTGSAVVGTPSYKNVLDSEFNKFTVPLFGGFDGLDITEKEPFRNTFLEDGTETTNYAFNSIKRALNTVSDPEVVEYNLLAMPGIFNESLLAHAIGICEARGDVLAVIDVDSGYRASTENTSTAENRRGYVSTAIDFVKELGLNTSYGCAYYPWVQVRDTISNGLIWMPPSVVALGTFSSSQKKSKLWFAPAGFNRGGLTAGAGGLPVLNVADRLNKDDRDKLYLANINPIGVFPAEGIMILGQKTLQFTPSALDRINVRRLMIHLKKEISKMATSIVFEQNVRATWKNFTDKADPFLASVVSDYGLTSYKLILDETTTTPDLIDRNVVYGKIIVVPAKSIEFFAIDFVISNTGASFED